MTCQVEPGRLLGIYFLGEVVESIMRGGDRGLLGICFLSEVFGGAVMGKIGG